jgi:amino acid transporter
MIWSELGAKYPLAGGTYNFHRIAFGEKGGRLMSFLFVWQTSIQAPLVVASAAIGFAQYLTYIVDLSTLEQKLVSGGLVIFVLLLLYRKIETIGKISVIFGIIVIGTIAWIIFSGLTHSTETIKFLPVGNESFFQFAFWSMIAQGATKTVYSYLGYYNVCHLGAEIRNPERNIPRSIFISITGIAVLYLLMNISIMSVIPWQEAAGMDKYLVSNFMEKVYGHSAAVVVTVLILCVAMSSLFAVVLGYSRVPYAAAVDGNFFRVFGKLHPKRNFPHISLLILCGLGFLFSMLFKLTEVITAILAMRILIQFMAQCIGVVLVRKRNGEASLRFRMWLYPLPVIISLILWGFLLYNNSLALYGLGIALLGAGVYFLTHHMKKD